MFENTLSRNKTTSRFENQTWSKSSLYKSKGVRIACLLGASALTAASSGTAAFGQDNPQMQDRQGFMDEVVVTARKREESLSDVSLSIEAFNEDALDNLQVTDVTDLQQATSNLFITETGSFASGVVNSSIRGISAPLGFSSSVGFYVDDVFIANNTGQLLDLLDVERVEVLKGPQGTLFGRNTTGGAVRIISAKPGEEFGGSVSAELGNYGAYALKGSVSGPIVDDTLYAGLSAMVRQRDGFQTDINTGEDYWTEDKWAARGSLYWTPTQNFSAHLNYTYIENNSVNRVPVPLFNEVSFEDNLLIAEASGFLLPEGLQEFEFFGIERTPPSAFTDVDLVSTDVAQDQFFTNQGQLNLVLDYEFSDAWSAKSISSYVEAETFFPLDLEGSNNLLINNLDNNAQDFFSQEFQLKYNGDRFRGVAGVYYLDFEQTEFETDPATGSSVSSLFINQQIVSGIANAFGASVEDTLNNGFLALAGQELQPAFILGGIGIEDEVTTTESIAFFINGEFDITDRLTLDGGLRFSNEERAQSENELDQTILPAFFVTGAGDTLFFNDNIAGAEAALTAQLGAPLGVIPSSVIDGGTSEVSASADFEDVTYRVGLSYDLDQGLAYGYVATGFRAGGFNSIEDANGFGTFDSEKVRTYALGYKSDILGGNFAFDLEAFYNDIDDLQYESFAVFPSGQVDSTTGNFGKAETYGVDLGLRFMPTENFSVDANLGYLKTNITEALEAQEVDDLPVLVDIADSLEIGRAPEWTANLAATYTLDLDGRGALDFIGQLAYQSDTPTIQPLDRRDPGQLLAIQDDYALVNGRIVYTSENQAWEFFAEGKNLFDKRVATDAFDLGSFLSQGYNAPRTYRAGITWNFGAQ